MVLYLVYDIKQNTVSGPIIGPDLETAQAALKEINPENYDDLRFHELCNFKYTADLFRLDIDVFKKIPEWIQERFDIPKPDYENVKNVELFGDEPVLPYQKAVVPNEGNPDFGKPTEGR